MSWYTTYYLAYQKADGKVYPLGPFDNNGNYHSVRSTSRSFTTDLKEMFHVLDEEKCSDELANAIFSKYNTECDYDDLSDWEKRLEYLPLSDLPKDSYIKSGYYLIDDIKEYERGELDESDLFYESMTPHEYCLRLANEMLLGKPENKKDCEGEEIEAHSCADYAFFSYPDYTSKEYEAFLLRVFADVFEYSLGEDEKIVVVKTEG